MTILNLYVVYISTGNKFIYRWYDSFLEKYNMAEEAIVIDSSTVDINDNSSKNGDDANSDDKFARSDVECFVLDDYFVPKQEELRMDVLELRG